MSFDEHERVTNVLASIERVVRASLQNADRSTWTLESCAVLTSDDSLAYRTRITLGSCTFKHAKQLQRDTSELVRTVNCYHSLELGRLCAIVVGALVDNRHSDTIRRSVGYVFVTCDALVNSHVFVVKPNHNRPRESLHLHFSINREHHRVLAALSNSTVDTSLLQPLPSATSARSSRTRLRSAFAAPFGAFRRRRETSLRNEINRMFQSDDDDDNEEQSASATASESRALLAPRNSNSVQVQSNVARSASTRRSGCTVM